MTNWIRNQIADLYNAVSASVPARRDTLSERLQNVRGTSFLLYNIVMDNIEYRRERLKETNEQEEEQTEENIDLTTRENDSA